PPVASGGVHAEVGRIDLLAVNQASGGDLLERALVDDEQFWAHPFAREQPGDDQRAIVDEHAFRNPDFDKAVCGLASALHLHGDVFAVRQALDHCIQASVEQWKEDVKSSMRLLNELCPHP